MRVPAEFKPTLIRIDLFNPRLLLAPPFALAVAAVSECDISDTFSFSMHYRVVLADSGGDLYAGNRGEHCQ
jgi:hypothetical protein